MVPSELLASLLYNQEFCSWTGTNYPNYQLLSANNIANAVPSMNFQEIPVQHLSCWKNSIAEVEMEEQPKKHKKIEKAFSQFNWAIPAPNFLIVLILLMSFITPSSCTIENTEVQMPFGASEADAKEGAALSYSALYRCCSECGGLPALLSQVQESQHEAKITVSEPATENTTTEMPGNSTSEETESPESFDYWVAHSGLGDEIRSKLDMEKEDIDIDAAKEVLTALEPPPPPSDTVPKYNIWLDKPRPTTIEEYLRNFEVVFVVDDSGSMKGTRWTETRDALETIADKTFELNVDTVSMRFLNDATCVRGLKGKNNLTLLFDAVQPKGWTPLGRALKSVFREHLDRVDSAIEKDEEEYSKIPPLDIIVLTDGVPTDKGEDQPAKVVAKAVKRLNDNHYHPNTMGVQIVQIASEEKAKKVLKDLVVGDNGRIVDTVPYAGTVDSKKLLRILLGGIHPNIRSQLPAAMLAT